jgi:hypothetical protein
MLQSMATSQEFRQKRQQQMQVLQIVAAVLVHFMQPLSITSGFTASSFTSSCFGSLDIIY